jgi:hypothetical protein
MFAALLIDDTGCDFLLAAGVAAFLLELVLKLLVLALALGAGSFGHDGSP